MKVDSGRGGRGRDPDGGEKGCEQEVEEPEGYGVKDIEGWLGDDVGDGSSQ
jgi:hypothetical protein